MPNRSYANSARRELQIKAELEEGGWYAIRASGSHGIADVVAVRPCSCCYDLKHYETKFIQIKTSQNTTEKRVELKEVLAKCGKITVEFWYFPVKNKAFWEKHRRRKSKVAKKN